MLDDQQLEWLCAQLALTAEALGHAVSPAAAAMMASDLSSYAQPVLQRALTRVLDLYLALLRQVKPDAHFAEAAH